MAKTKQTQFIKGDGSKPLLAAAKLVAQQKKKMYERKEYEKMSQKKKNQADKQARLDNKSHKGRKLNNWKKKDMADAIQYKLDMDMPGSKLQKLSMRAIARKFNVPFHTFRKRVIGKIAGDDHMSGGKGQPKVLPKKVEDELVDMIEEYSLLGFPFTPKEIRTIAYDFAQDHNLKGFSQVKEIAGPHWFESFLSRHDQLRVKSGVTNLSIARALATTKEACDHWFDCYEDVLRQLDITDPKYIWNIDEHGIEDMPKSTKVVGIKNTKQYAVVSKEKPARSTMLTYVNGAGYALPPMIIHRGKFHGSMRKGAPSNKVLVRTSKKGYITKKLFAEYGKQLLYHLHAIGQLDKPNIILMDSHYSHVFNYCFIEMMYSRDIKIMAFEPHTSHWNQPLDKNPFSGFKTEFHKALHKFNRRVGGRSLRKDEFFSLFNIAWERGITKRNIIAGYKRTGIWPCDRDVIPVSTFAPSKITAQKKLAEAAGASGDAPQPAQPAQPAKPAKAAKAAEPDPGPSQYVADSEDEFDSDSDSGSDGVSESDTSESDGFLSNVRIRPTRPANGTAKKSTESQVKKLTTKPVPKVMPKRKKDTDTAQQETLEEPVQPETSPVPQLQEPLTTAEVEEFTNKEVAAALKNAQRLAKLTKTWDTPRAKPPAPLRQSKRVQQQQEEQETPLKAKKRPAEEDMEDETPDKSCKRTRIELPHQATQGDSTVVLVAADVHRDPTPPDSVKDTSRSTEQETEADEEVSSASVSDRPISISSDDINQLRQECADNTGSDFSSPEPKFKPVSSSEDTGPKQFKCRVFYSKKKLETAAEKAERTQAIKRDVAAVVKTIGTQGVKTSIQDYFQKPVYEKPTRKPRRNIIKDMPSYVYTDDKCRQIIKTRDKNANDEYVKEYNKDLADIPKKH